MSRYSIHSFNSNERQALASIDADTTDYYDGPEGLPPPHRLSSRFSGAAYPEAPTTWDQPLQQPHALSNAYNDPFATVGASTSAAAIAGTRQQHNPFRDSYRDSMSYDRPSHDAYPPTAVGGNGVGGRYPAPPAAAMGAGAGAGMAAAGLYDAPGRPDSFDDYRYRNEADTWGVGAGSNGQYDDDERAGMITNAPSSNNLARDRYVQRKEAEAAAGGGDKEGGYGYAYASGAGAKSGSRRKWWLIGGGVALLAIVAIVVGAVVASKSKKSDSSPTNNVVKVNNGDPSDFEKDSRLHKSFYGMCYTPQNAQYPACGDKLADVITDVQIMSQLSSRLRLYGADCNVTELVLEAIQQTKVNMTIFPAIWINDDDTIYQRGAKAVLEAIQKYGTDHIDGVTVGNEYLLNGGSVSNLVAKMADFRTQLQALNLPKTPPVGTGDAGSMITLELAQGADYIMANNHPYFAGTTVEDAAGWTWDYTNTNTPSVALTATNKPTLYISEIGWPSGANETRELTYEGAVAGMPQLQTFLDSYVCAANQNGTTALSFWFEFFDETWKDKLYGGVEGYWGLFYANRTMKPITIPDCASL